MVPAIAFVGHSGSGKTTLLIKMLPLLARRGVKVAVVKHAPRHIGATDTPGSDSYRLWEAGAPQVALVTRDRVVHSWRCESEPVLADVLEHINGVDLILIEGYKRSTLPKIEVVRRVCNPRPLEGLGRRIACVTDVEGLEMGVPCFGLNEPEAVADFLVQALAAREEGNGPLAGD